MGHFPPGVSGSSFAGSARFIECACCGREINDENPRKDAPRQLDGGRYAYPLVSNVGLGSMRTSLQMLADGCRGCVNDGLRRLAIDWLTKSEGDENFEDVTSLLFEDGLEKKLAAA